MCKRMNENANPRTILFDLNETLLDMSALDPLFADAFGDKSVRRVWFAQTVQLAMSATILDAYADFGEIAKAALDMTARKRGVNVDDERKRRILRGLAALPPHGDVAPGLRSLRDAGCRLAILTNASEDAARAQLENAKLAALFDVVISTDAVRRFKPASEAYAHAAERLETPARDLLLVAAHDWDVAGAMHAGLEAAFVARHGTSPNPLDRKPAISAPDIRAIADAIVALPAA